MPLTVNGNPIVNPVGPVNRWIWISIYLLFTMIAISGCHPTRPVAPSEKGGANFNRLQPISPDPEASPEDAKPQFEAASQSTPTASAARPSAGAPSAVPDTPTPVATAAADLLPPPVLGGADKIAYLDDNNIWVANLDGSEVIRLTNDGLGKSNLQWSPDGQAVDYISEDKCLYRVRLAEKIEERLVCFPFAEYFRAFASSPEGEKVAVSVDNWLYVLPYDLALLNTVDSHSVLTENAVCEYFDPLEKDPDHRIVAKFIRWSADGQRLAFVTNSADSLVGDVSIVRVITYDDCNAVPRALNYFPAWHLLPDEYNNHPVLANFGWNGKDLFSFVAVTERESGFGALFIYYTNLWKLVGPIDLITDCCYRDPNLSPDGSSLLFAYQANSPDGDIRLYLAPVGDIGVQSTLTPLPLPQIAPRSQPQAVLRSALPTPGP